MTVNRNHYQTRYRHLPPWECPTCGKGHLVAIKDKEAVEETGPSRRARATYEEWDPEWTEERFTKLLKCNFANCGEVVSVSGNASIEEEHFQDEVGDWEHDFVRHYEVQSLLPAPLPIRPIAKTPDAVKGPLRIAGQLLWQSPEAAANHVRQAVEHLMDQQKVKKRVKAGGKKLTLHDRLLEFEKRDGLNGPILRAIKWIGNDGSHQGGVSREEVLDAFDMMELALTNLFDDEAAKIMKKVQAVIKAKEKKPKPKSAAAAAIPATAAGPTPTPAPKTAP
jgi:hypothetical protein